MAEHMAPEDINPQKNDISLEVMENWYKQESSDIGEWKLHRKLNKVISAIILED